MSKLLIPLHVDDLSAETHGYEKWFLGGVMSFLMCQSC
jgi:hypothetical protein